MCAPTHIQNKQNALKGCFSSLLCIPVFTTNPTTHHFPPEWFCASVIDTDVQLTLCTSFLSSNWTYTLAEPKPELWFLSRCYIAMTKAPLLLVLWSSWLPVWNIHYLYYVLDYLKRLSVGLLEQLLHLCRSFCLEDTSVIAAASVRPPLR